MEHAIWAEGLAKRYGDTIALDGVDLAVPAGTVLGLLGPNGAGKTTTVRILATLLSPDAGSATVAGYDVVSQAHAVRQVIGLTGQYAAVDETLTGTENLLFIARLLGMSRADSRARAAELLASFGLEDAANRAAKTSDLIRKLMKPAPAISGGAARSLTSSLSMICWANCRGLARACLASTMAAFVW